MRPHAALARLTPVRLDARLLRRMVLAGTAWGVAALASLTAIRTWRYGTVCLEAAAFDGLVTAMIGTVTIGPLAAVGRRVDRRRN
ncbi:MAG: hypothetical protein HXX10_12065 [Rhodoplanes sp.]|uniref:hypothetical protein n=1 Tax=Rhodoplanes sp. TaxID=1968906 RepID=UPI0017D44FC0|nr:hypothetical protein [Rhodoplanes sp.]NVO14763.1 hypothetical protein [Rhodoplanes sp.]